MGSNLLPWNPQEHYLQDNQFRPNIVLTRQPFSAHVDHSAPAYHFYPAVHALPSSPTVKLPHGVWSSSSYVPYTPLT